jgi:hypothetical protein
MNNEPLQIRRVKFGQKRAEKAGHAFMFNNLSQVAACARHEGNDYPHYTSNRKRGGDGFHYFNSLEEALQAMQHGWHDSKADKINLADTTGFENLYAEYQDSSEYEWEQDVFGSSVNVPTYLSGDPFYMENLETKQMKSITLLYSCSVSAYVSISTIINYGKVVFTLAKLLEANGYQVKIMAIGNSSSFFALMTIKDFEEYTPEEILKFTMINPDFSRRVVFALKENCPPEQRKYRCVGFDGGYGRPEQELPTNIGDYLDNYVYIKNNNGRTTQTIEQTNAFIKSVMEKILAEGHNSKLSI